MRHWVFVFGTPLVVTFLLSLSLLNAQSGGVLPCCEWKCYPLSGQQACQQSDPPGTGMCRWDDDPWGNWDECTHAPPVWSNHIEDTPPSRQGDHWKGQCEICCDLNGDSIPDPTDVKMNLWWHERWYLCGLICYGEFTTLKDSPEPVRPETSPICVL